MNEIIICDHCKGSGYSFKRGSVSKESCKNCLGSGRLVKKIVYEAYKCKNEEKASCEHSNIDWNTIKIGNKYALLMDYGLGRVALMLGVFKKLEGNAVSFLNYKDEKEGIYTVDYKYIANIIQID